jgi:hypothetical protein
MWLVEGFGGAEPCKAGDIDVPAEWGFWCSRDVVEHIWAPVALGGPARTCCVLGPDLGEGQRLARQHGYVGYGKAAGGHVNTGCSVYWYLGHERSCCSW